jgi:colanic acid/amylovoran biosynthesis glycosyltransferase
LLTTIESEKKPKVEKSSKPTIAHLMSIYLPITETWIYSQLTNINRFNSIVITDIVQNAEIFPFHDVYRIPVNSKFRKLLNKIFRGLTNRQTYSRKLIQNFNTKLLHAHFGPEGVRYLRLKNALGLPLITSFYGVDISVLPKIPFWLKEYTRLFEEGDLFLVEGSCMKNELTKIGCPAEKICLQHLGVDVDKIEFKPRMLHNGESVTVLVAGSFREKKGIPYALKAFARAKEKHPEIRLRILGDGELRSQIDLLIKDLRLADSVTLLGYQPYSVFLKELYDAQIFMHPSITAQDGDTEGGAPVSILEAQASGLPVISSYHADIPETVIDGKSALLAPEKDVDTLTRHLNYLIEQPEQWEKFGLAGRKHIEENYSLKTQVKKLENIYDAVSSTV